MNQARFGIYWRYNVHQDGVPLVAMGRVFYVTDDFGRLVMVNERRTTYSLT